MIRSQPTEICCLPTIKKSFSEEMIDHLGASNKEEMAFMSPNRLTKRKIYNNHLFKTYEKSHFPSKRLTKLFNDYILPNVFGCLFFFIISYIDYSMPCIIENFALIFWKNFKIIIFEHSFYPLIYYYLLFPLVLGKIKCKKKKKKIKVLYGLTSLCTLTFSRLLVAFDLQETMMIMHPMCFLNAYGFLIIICKQNNIKFNNSFKMLAISTILPAILFADYYVIKKEIIIRLINTEFSKDHKLFFKIIIFIYFYGYRNLLKRIIIYHFRFIKKRNLRNENNGILYFLNFNFSDIMSATLVPALINHNDFYSILINLFFFTYQLAIIYMKSDFIIDFLKKLLFYAFSIKTKKRNDRRREQARHLMIISLNEILVIMYLRIIFINFTKKFMIKSDFTNDLSDSCLFFNSNMKITYEFLFLIILINILIYGTVYFSSKIQEDLIQQKPTKNKKLSFFGSVFRILIKYYYVEVFFEFYFYLAFRSEGKPSKTL